MTLTTVGYGDLHPVTPAAKVFTMVYVFLGIGVLVAFVTRLAQALGWNAEAGCPRARSAVRRNHFGDATNRSKARPSV